MSAAMLRVIGFAIGVIAGVLCFVIVGMLKGSAFPGLGALSVFVGILVGGMAQASLVKRFTQKVARDV